MTSKQYRYNKGAVNLNFSLRSDIKSEMRDFIELLKKATVEVEADLAANKSKK